MLKDKSTDFKTLILLRIAKKLIINTESYAINKLENILNNNNISSNYITISKEENEEKIKQNIIFRKNKIKEDVKNKISMSPSIKIKEGVMTIAPIDRKIEPVLNKKFKSIPRGKQLIISPKRKKIEYNDSLPDHLKYLKPTPIIKKMSMDLGKLNPYLEDPNIDSIEVEGENEKVYVIGKMGKKPTSLILNRDEIDEIIDKFSTESKIPKTEGLFKTSINNLILTAMVSTIISSRFIIKKIKI